VAKADAAALAGLLASAKPEIRYHAARRLAGAPESAKTAGKALAQHAGDEQEAWPVRRQCLLALRHVPDASLLPLLNGLLKPDLRVLWAAAATALAGQGAPGRDALFAALDADYQAERERGMLWPGVVTALGASAAAEVAPGLRERFAAGKDGDNGYKSALVRIMGKAKDGDSVKWLIELLQKTANDDIRKACTGALADSGDAEAREILDLALAAARKTKNEGMIEACEAALRRWR
jgi:HEAT repeat protein